MRKPNKLAKEIAEVVRIGEMPPRQYLLLNPEAKLMLQAVQALIAGTPSGAGLQVERERYNY